MRHDGTFDPLLKVLAARLLAPRGYVRYVEDHFDNETPAILTYGVHHLDAMEATEFERACAALLARDGFTRVQHSGRAGDLGADAGRALDPG
ncbi:restriction endonuclease [Kitasatospora sp. NPDC001119]